MSEIKIQQICRLYENNSQLLRQDLLHEFIHQDPKRLDSVSEKSIEEASLAS